MGAQIGLSRNAARRYFEKKDKISSRKMCYEWFHHIKEVKKLEIKKELDALNSYVEEVKFIL